MSDPWELLIAIFICDWKVFGGAGEACFDAARAQSESRVARPSLTGPWLSALCENRGPRQSSISARRHSLILDLWCVSLAAVAP